MSRFWTLIVLITVLATGAGTLSGQVGRRQNVLDPNIASEKELLALPHLNPTLAKGILEKRPFLSMTDLNGLLSQSLGKPQLTEVYGRMFVALNLNTASEQEILLIPGMGPRMLHEFLEYRPYRALAQFRRELANTSTTRRLHAWEQYVFVPINLNGKRRGHPEHSRRRPAQCCTNSRSTRRTRRSNSSVARSVIRE